MADSSTDQLTTELSDTKILKNSLSPLQTMLQRPVLMHFDPEKKRHGNDVTLLSHSHQDILIGLVHSIGLTLAVVGNLSVIVIIARTKKLHTSSSLFVLVLAISDLLLSLFWNLVPLLLTFDKGVNQKLLESGLVCNIIGFAWQTMLTISTLSHSIVAFDRFIFIVHPMKYQVYVTIRATSVFTCIIVVVASLMSAITLISKSDFRFHQFAGMCIGSPIWPVLYILLIFIPSLSLALVAYQRIWKLCASIFKQEDNILSRGHSPHLCDYTHRLPLSLSSSRNHSRSDLSAIIDFGEVKTTKEGLDQKWSAHQTQTGDKESATGIQRNIMTTVTTRHTTKVTRMNTTTTTIADTKCQHEVPIENHRLQRDDIYTRTRTIGRKISEMTEVEVEERTSTSTEKTRTCSVTIHTNCPIPESSIQIQTTDRIVHSKSPSEVTSTPHYIPVTTASARGDTMGKRSYSKDSLFNFLSRKQRQCQNKNPSIVTTSAESISNNLNTDVNIIPVVENEHASSTNNTSHLNIIEPFPTIATTPPQHSSNRYDTVTRKLFGSDAILPSLLYVAILMPLSMHKTSPTYKQRRRKACLLIGLPVLIMAVSFLPFPGSLIYLGYLHTEDNIGDGAGMFLIKLICHLTYALVPSLTSLLLCLNNKPYRRALGQMLRCRCV